MPESSNHAKVDHANNLVRQDEDVSRVWVGVEQAMIEHLFQKSIRAPSCNLLEIVALCLELFHVRDFYAGNVLHGEDDFTRTIPEYFRNVNGCAVGEVGRKTFNSVTLTSKIHLPHDTATKFLDQPDRFVKRNGRNVLLDEVSQAHQDVDIGFYNSGYAWPPDFENNLFTASELAAVHLGNARRSERLCREFSEQFVHGIAQLALDLGFDLIQRDSRDFILQFTEFPDKLLVEDIGAGRKQLAEFDEGWSEFFHGHAQSSGLTESLQFPVHFVARNDAFAEFQVVVDVELFDKMAEPVFDQNAQNGSVTADRSDISVYSKNWQHG